MQISLWMETTAIVTHMSTSTTSETDSNESDEESVQDNPAATRTKRSGLKEWAQQRINPVEVPTVENLLERPIVARPRQPRPSDGILHGSLGSEDYGVP